MPEIRPARTADLHAILNLLREASPPLEGADTHLDRSLVADHAGDVVAAAGVEPYGSKGLLRSVVVSPTRRGVGLGEALCRKLLERAIGEGLEEMYLLFESAASFFSRLGFTGLAREQAPVTIRATPEFARLCPASAVLMRKILGAAADRLPRLERGRVRLRPITAADAPALFDIFSDPEVTRYWSRPPMTEIAQAEELVASIHAYMERGDVLQWGIVEAASPDDRVIGTCTLFHIDLGARRSLLASSPPRSNGWSRSRCIPGTSRDSRWNCSGRCSRRIGRHIAPGGSPRPREATRHRTGAEEGEAARIFPFRHYHEAGVLISYGPNYEVA